MARSNRKQKGGCFSWLFGKTRKSSESSKSKRKTASSNRINKNFKMGEDILDELENSVKSSKFTKQALNDNKFTTDRLSHLLTNQSRKISAAASTIQRMSRGHSARKTVKNRKVLKARIPELEKQIKELEEVKTHMPKGITKQKSNATRRIGELKSILSSIKEQ